MLGQLLFEAARNRYPHLTKHQFDVATQAVVDRHAATKRITISILAAELEKELRKRHHHKQ